MQIHDYTHGHRGWGHDFCVLGIIDGGKLLRVSGWGVGIKVGDALDLQNGTGKSFYLVVEIKYMSDPADQWFATVAHRPDLRLV